MQHFRAILCMDALFQSVGLSSQFEEDPFLPSIVTSCLLSGGVSKGLDEVFVSQGLEILFDLLFYRMEAKPYHMILLLRIIISRYTVHCFMMKR